MKRLLWPCALLLLPWSLAAQSAMEPEVSLDRTAFFVGEPIRYQVRVRHDPSVQFIVDRLDKANLEMAPFTVQAVEFEQGRRGSQELLTVTLQLVTYEVTAKEWKIPPFNLYYTASDAAAANEERPVQRLTVPATPVAFRSSLPPESQRIRTNIEVEHFSMLYRGALSVGLIGLLIAGVRGGQLAFSRVRRATPQREERSAVERRTADAVRRLLDARDVDDGAAETLDFYREMTAILREYAGALTERRGGSLTSPEVADALAREDHDRARRIADLVAFGDYIRYADDPSSLARDRFAGTRQELQDLFGS